MGCSLTEWQDHPKVSLITVVLNGGEALARTFDSVFAQTYQPIDYIVIDGGSTDGSINLIKQHHERITFWVSEPDSGISDAFNKGIAAAKGDYIGLLNADDWLSPQQIEEAVRALETNNAGFAFGDLLYHAPSGETLHKIHGDPDYGSKIKSLMPALNHPTLLAKRQVFDEIGGFDRHYHVAMDYDWALRAHLAGHKGIYSSKIVGHMTLNGTSDRHFIEGLKEVRQIAIRHGQSMVLAWSLFSLRVVKGMMQRQLRRYAPASLYRWLRGRFNRDYQPVSQDLVSQDLDHHVENSGSHR